jgi:hypothetical protein
VRLFIPLSYVTPMDKLAGLDKAIFAERDRKLEAARELRQRSQMVRSTASKALQTNHFPGIPASWTLYDVGRQAKMLLIRSARQGHAVVLYERRLRGQNRSRNQDLGWIARAFAVCAVPGLAATRQTLSAGSREICHRIAPIVTCAGRPKFQFAVNQDRPRHRHCAAASRL